MTLPVFLAPSLAASSTGAVLEVEGDEARHAVVRRVRPGERVAVTDGAGRTALCEVLETGRQRLVARVVELAEVDPPQPVFVVVQAIPKGDRGERAVEMLTEVGVDEIVPWSASRCVAVWRGDRAAKALTKWQVTAREAAKQSRRAWFPTVREPASTTEVVGLMRDAALSVVLHEEAVAPLAALEVPANGRVVLVVGPEGGITDEEIALFAGAGAEPVRMGSSVLRTSTAGVAAVAALSSRTPRWS